MILTSCSAAGAKSTLDTGRRLGNGGALRFAKLLEDSQVLPLKQIKLRFVFRGLWACHIAA
jgi:hypothetical protein